MDLEQLIVIVGSGYILVLPSHFAHAIRSTGPHWMIWITGVMRTVLELTMICGWVNSVLSRFVVGNLPRIWFLSFDDYLSYLLVEF